MLRFILGTAGTGKTTLIVEQIKQAAENGKNAIWLVPEQFSFEAERILYRVLGPKLALKVEVLSFTRLCNAVFRKFGGLAGVPVTPAGKYILMSIALDEIKDTLEIYRKSVNNTSFLDMLVSTCRELKTSGITEQHMAELSQRCEEEALGDKLNEISHIYATYQALLARGYTDPDDDLLRTVKILSEQNFFQGTELFVDGFTTFMAGEFMILEKAIMQADACVFAFTADGLNDQQQGTGVFSPAKEASARLIRYANKSGMKIEAPIILEEPHKYQRASLTYLSQNLYEPVLQPFTSKSDDGVQIRSAKDIYEEMEYVAASISDLVCTYEYRYNEIAVVARDTQMYSRAIYNAFSQYGIPYFEDGKEEVENHPLVSGLLLALDAVRSNFNGESVIQYAKSPICGLEPEAVAEVENYGYSWDVRGTVWTLPFSNSPRGLAEQLTENDSILLDHINSTRQQIIEPLIALKKALYDTNAKQFAKGIYEFLLLIDAPGNLTAYAQKMLQGEKETFLEQSAQLWDVMMEILDVFGSVLGNVKMGSRRLFELFRLAVNTAEIGQIPQTLDQVLVGMADRIRPGEIRAVFIIGANEGIFPAQVNRGGIFTDQERQKIIDLGVEIAPPTLKQAVLERYFAYFAMTLPKELLVVSYCRSDLLGREQQPSVLISQLKALFEDLVETKPRAEILLTGQKAIVKALAASYREDTPFTSALLCYAQEKGESEIIERIQFAANTLPHQLDSAVVTNKIFSSAMRLSPSKVEHYYRCPFSYFVADGLSLKKRKKVEFTPLESGSVIHEVLQIMVKRHGAKNLATLDEAQLLEETKEIIMDYLKQRIEDMDVMPARFKYLFGRLTATLVRLLKHLGEEFSQSAFEPVAFELPISSAEGVPPLKLQTIDGKSVTVEGIVDRVDIMEKNGRRYVRVVDYKSGNKDFNLYDILYGLNLQMLIYLFTIAENGQGLLAGCIPAGVLYMPVREAFSTSPRDISEEERKKEQQKQWKMNGLLLEDTEVLSGMEADLAGVFIPAKLGKNGSLDARSAVASKAELGKLSVKVKELVANMANALSQGKIEAYPVSGGDFDTCEYCDYRRICGFEQGDPVREISKVDKESFFKQLEDETHG